MTETIHIYRGVLLMSQTRLVVDVVYEGGGQAPSVRPSRACGPTFDPGSSQLGFFGHRRMVCNYPHVAHNLGFIIFEDASTTTGGAFQMAPKTANKCYGPNIIIIIIIIINK